MVQVLKGITSWQVNQLTLVHGGKTITWGSLASDSEREATLKIVKKLEKVNDELWTMIANVLEIGPIERLEITEAQCSNEATVAAMMKALNGITSWKVGK